MYSPVLTEISKVGCGHSFIVAVKGLSSTPRLSVHAFGDHDNYEAVQTLTVDRLWDSPVDHDVGGVGSTDIHLYSVCGLERGSNAQE